MLDRSRRGSANVLQMQTSNLQTCAGLRSCTLCNRRSPVWGGQCDCVILLPHISREDFQDALICSKIRKKDLYFLPFFRPVSVAVLRGATALTASKTWIERMITACYPATKSIEGLCRVQATWIWTHWTQSKHWREETDLMYTYIKVCVYVNINMNKCSATAVPNHTYCTCVRIITYTCVAFVWQKWIFAEWLHDLKPTVWKCRMHLHWQLPGFAWSSPAMVYLDLIHFYPYLSCNIWSFWSPLSLWDVSCTESSLILL